MKTFKRIAVLVLFLKKITQCMYLEMCNKQNIRLGDTILTKKKIFKADQKLFKLLQLGFYKHMFHGLPVRGKISNQKMTDSLLFKVASIVVQAPKMQFP